MLLKYAYIVTKTYNQVIEICMYYYRNKHTTIRNKQVGYCFQPFDRSKRSDR